MHTSWNNFSAAIPWIQPNSAWASSQTISAKIFILQCSQYEVNNRWERLGYRQISLDRIDLDRSPQLREMFGLARRPGGMLDERATVFETEGGNVFLRTVVNREEAVKAAAKYFGDSDTWRLRDGRNTISYVYQIVLRIAPRHCLPEYIKHWCFGLTQFAGIGEPWSSEEGNAWALFGHLVVPWPYERNVTQTT